MEYRVRSQSETNRNAKRAMYSAKFRYAQDVIEELQRRGITEYPARFKGMSEAEYKRGLIDVLIANDTRIA